MDLREVEHPNVWWNTDAEADREVTFQIDLGQNLDLEVVMFRDDAKMDCT